MNRNELMSPKEKFVAAKRVDAKSSIGKKNEASKTVKEKSSSIQCWKCKGFGHMSKECVNKKVMVKGMVYLIQMMNVRIMIHNLWKKSQHMMMSMLKKVIPYL